MLTPFPQPAAADIRLPALSSRPLLEGFLKLFVFDQDSQYHAAGIVPKMVRDVNRGEDIRLGWRASFGMSGGQLAS